MKSGLFSTLVLVIVTSLVIEVEFYNISNLDFYY